MKKKKDKVGIEKKAEILESIKTIAQEEYSRKTGETYDTLSAIKAIKKHGYWKAMLGGIWLQFLLVIICSALTVISVFKLILCIVQFLIIEPVRMLFKRD